MKLEVVVLYSDVLGYQHFRRPTDFVHTTLEDLITIVITCNCKLTAVLMRTKPQ